MYVVSRLAPFKSGEVVSGELWPRISRTKWLISYTPNAGQGLFNTIVATQNHQVAILFVGRHSTVKIVKRFAMIHPLTLFRQKHIECTILVGIRCLVLRVFVFHPILILYTSGGTKFMLLESFTKHPFRSTADHIFKSVLCGRCGTVNYHPLLNI